MMARTGSAERPAEAARRRTIGVPRRWQAALLLVAAFAALLPNFRPERDISRHFIGGYEPLEVARSLAAGKGFANPYRALPTGATAHTPPVYPFFLAALIRVFGNTMAFALAASLGWCAALALGIALLPAISQAVFHERAPGLWGACLAVFLPLFDFAPQFETAYAATGVLVFCLFAERTKEAARPWAPLALGVLGGLLALLQPATAMATAPWLAWSLLRRRPGARKQFVALAAAGFLLAVAPWTWRNFRQFHEFIFVRDNLGIELHVSNNDEASAPIRANRALFTIHPNASVQEARALLEMGEIEYNRSRERAALEWIRSHPRRFLELTAERARLFWFTAAQTEPARVWPMALMTLVSFAGMALLVVRREPAAVPILMVSLLYPAIYYAVQVDHRYREPILWVSLLSAGYALSGLAAVARRRA